MITLEAIPVASITTGTNDRKVFDQTELEALAASIAEVGLAEPIAVRPLGDGTYRLIAGERRWRAHQLLGLETIDATIRDDVDERAEANIMLAENTGRVNLSHLEEARAYAKRVEAGQTVEEIARVAGVAEFRVRWRLDLLELLPEIQSAIEAGAVTPQAALDMRRLDPNYQMIALKAWMANPSMGAVRFRRLVEKLAAEQAKNAEMTFGFAIDDEHWIAEAKAQPSAKRSMSSLLDLIAQMSVQLEALGYAGPLLDEAATLR